MSINLIKDFFKLKVVNDAKNFSHIAIPKFIISKNDKEVLNHFKKYEGFIEKIWIENNFVNIIFSVKILDLFKGKLKLIFNIDEKNLENNKRKKVLIEHTSNNPTGPIHIGRIRNTLIGDFLVRLYRKFNFNVESHFYVNDLGKQIILIKYGFDKGIAEKINEIQSDKYKKYEKYKNREDFITFFVYNFINEELKNGKIDEKEIENLLLKAEKDINIRNSLKERANFALKGIKKTFKRLNVHFDKFDYESDFLEDSKKYLNELKIKFNKEDPLVITLNVNGKKEEVYLSRENGTTTYLARDIAYHKWKEKNGDLLINVLGEDHKREFAILNELLKIIGFNKDLEAVFYSFLTLNGQKFSTRKGNILTVDEFIDEGKNLLNGSELEKESLAIAALKTFLLKTHINKPIDFKWEEAIKNEGETGVYLVYSLVRAKSLLRKSSFEIFKSLAENKSTNEIISYLEEINNKINLNKISQDELKLFIKSLFYQDTLKESEKRKNPAYLLNYLFEFSQLFNKYYSKTKIIKSENEYEKLFFISIYKGVLEDALNLLNIPILEEIRKF